MKDIRVLLIAPALNILGGQAVQAARLLTGFRNEPGIRMDFQPLNANLYPSFLEKIPFVRTALREIVYCIKLLLRVPRYDIIHTFSAGKSSYTLWTIPALLISRLYGKKIIVNYRDGRAQEHLDNWRTAKPTLLMATAIVSPSDYLVHVFRDAGIPAQRIYNVIDTSGFIHRPRHKLKPVIMTNRSLEPLYNVGCIVRAFSIVQKQYPDARLIIAHDGPCRGELEDLVQELQIANVEFVGSVPHAKVPELYDSADIYMTSPNVDCMPGSLLECFASGLPVVATRAGGIPFIVTHEVSGMLVDLNDHEAMAAEAIRLIEDPYLVQHITRSGRQELEKYTWEEVRREWMNLYRGLATNNGAPGKNDNEAQTAA